MLQEGAGAFGALAQLLAGREPAEPERACAALVAPGGLKPKGQPDRKTKADIWEEEEVQALEEGAADRLALNASREEGDARTIPEYRITYQQSVFSEDLYLGLGGKQNAVAHANTLILTIPLPGTASLAELDLDVKQGHVELRSPRLALPLPERVDEDRGEAKWSPDTQLLTIHLPILRDFPIG